MDYGALPPEVNSGRMYVGPGSGPMLAAAAAWDGIATDLFATAASYGSVISELTGLWWGPASTSMAAAASPYVAWLTSTAVQAEQAAVQAKSAAAAYEAAFAMTVPPPVIAANRAQLMMLIATNFFGQNFPAIAATETHYAEMWAQDAVAMYGYAGASAAASALTTFDQPPSTTNPAGQAGQAAAVAHAAGTSAGTSAQSLPSVPSALRALALPTSSSTASTSVLSGLLGESSGSSSNPLAKLLTPSMYSNLVGMTYYHMGDYDHLLKIWEGLIPATAASTEVGVATSSPGLGGILGGGGPVSAAMPAGVSAGVGHAGTVGNLSVPPSWIKAAPAASLASTASPVSTVNTAPAGHGDGLLRGVPLTATGAGRRMGGDFGQRYGFRHLVMPRPPAAG